MRMISKVVTIEEQQINFARAGKTIGEHIDHRIARAIANEEQLLEVNVLWTDDEWRGMIETTDTYAVADAMPSTGKRVMPRIGDD